MGFSKPRPRPPKGKAGFEILTQEQRKKMAEDAVYVGSPHHTDVPKYGMPSAPRAGWMKLEDAELDKIKNPDCLVCPRKWVRRQENATDLLRSAIKAGYYVSDGSANMPDRIWAKDPEEDIVYEAKICEPPKGYKAYPLTSYQVAYNLPIKLP